MRRENEILCKLCLALATLGSDAEEQNDISHGVKDMMEDLVATANKKMVKSSARAYPIAKSYSKPVEEKTDELSEMPRNRMSQSNSNNLFSMVSNSLSKARTPSNEEAPPKPAQARSLASLSSAVAGAARSKPAKNTAKNVPKAAARSPSKPRASKPAKSFRLTEEQIMEYKEAFAVFDKDNDEQLSITDTIKVMHALGKRITNTQVKASLQPYTTQVDFPEFLTLMAQEVVDDGEESMREAIKGIFEFFDSDQKGYITAGQLRHVLTHLGECLTDEEVNSLLEDVDPDRKNKIRFEPFALYIMSK